MVVRIGGVLSSNQSEKLIGDIVCKLKPSSSVKESSALGEGRGVVGIYFLDVGSGDCCNIAEVVESVSELLILLVSLHSKSVEELSESPRDVDIPCDYKIPSLIKEINQVLHGD